MNHDEILDNRALPASDRFEHAGCDELVFAMRDRHHTFSLDMGTVLQCLQLAEQEGAVPRLPGDWWIAVVRRYGLPSTGGQPPVGTMAGKEEEPMFVGQAVRPLAFYDGNARTHCLASSDRFARSAVDSIIRTLPARDVHLMHLDAATPPYDVYSRIPAGHIEVTLIAADWTEYAIGIVFGAEDEAGRVLRQPFDSEGWALNPGYPWSSGLAAFNFDEAWRVVVLLAEKLQVARLEIGYGLGM